ncbi:Cytidylyltransferase family protein [Rickettsia monacensis]|uniref:Cytidylyltransferase family protein n=1 Tax=Rickettsia monacensis TaxID=109232 RepID=A0A0B7J1L1_9RICK|nr:diacylglycerol/polyprenol kinase family protein [Rickettsia monacensis]CDI29022.1 Cytidylyltransferase family protein [Rickettsia monacensis IrR/Munich]CEO16810.1 Cytidylyltransferase family protein [Rickettsia monacensis]
MEIKDFDFEKKRKIFHLSAIIFPLLYLFIPRTAITLLLFIITVITLYLDVSRHNNAKISEFVTRFFSKVIRLEENNSSFALSGISFMMLGFFLTALLFPKNLVICSWLILIISDCLAALVGVKIGNSLSNGKSVSGSVTFLASAIFISILGYFYLGYNTSFIIIIISCIGATAAEFYSKDLRINDNLSIPLSYCLSTAILSYIL